MILKAWRKKSRRAPRIQPGSFVDKRGRIIAAGCFVTLGILSLRATTIHLFPPSSESLQSMADRQYQRHLELSPYRGTIYDRRGEPLAMSIRMPSLFVNPRVFQVSRREAQKLGALLDMSPEKVSEISEKKSYFSWLKRKVPKDVAARVAELKIKGLHQVMEPSRFYPSGGAAAHVIGSVGIDNSGLMGMEKQFDRVLRGQTVRVDESRDARGRTIFLQSANAAPEKSGQNLHLTLDKAVQEIAEHALEKGVRQARAKSGFAIVSDPHTGRIMALANYPVFDPNNQKSLDLSATRNHALSDVFEPGSVVKPFVVASALANNKVTMDEVFDCDNGVYREPGLRIRDSHPSKTLTVEDVLVESSNICTYKIAQRLGPERLHQTFLDFGLGTPASLLEFPGKAVGRLTPWQNWKTVRFANISFGQGFITTGLEIIRAFGALANGGNLMEPYLVDRIESADGEVHFSHAASVVRRVIEPEVARKMRMALRSVVDRGSGSRAQMAAYSAGGKTGTTEKVDPRTRAYAADLRLASFAGFAPVEDPHLVIYVVVDEPGVKPYYGGVWAAPVFKEIAENTLRYLNVAPDKAPVLAHKQAPAKVAID